MKEKSNWRVELVFVNFGYAAPNDNDIGTVLKWSHVDAVEYDETPGVLTVVLRVLAMDSEEAMNSSLQDIEDLQEMWPDAGEPRITVQPDVVELAVDRAINKILNRTPERENGSTCD